jgi:predicted nucleic-acid-binding Zn-ribbon protein
VKQSLRCPKCGCRQLWVVDPAVQLLDTNAFERVPMIVAKLEYKDMYKYPAMKVGRFQVVICANAQCGYTEWYAYNLERMHEASLDPKSGVRFIDGDAGNRGPYR